MEIRPMHTVCRAGRAASRWATAIATPASNPSLSISMRAANWSRTFSSSCPARQEAEATAPAPANNMADLWHQQQQQQQRQSPLPASQNTASTAKNDIFDNDNALREPWFYKKQAARIVPNKVVTTDEAFRDLEISSEYYKPTMDDLSREKKIMREKMEDRRLRLRPVIGRTIDFKKIKDSSNRDLARGLSLLNMSCNLNRVLADSRMQKFHERLGKKKKRQKSERWRRRFKEGFKATCERVSELARQGW